MPEKRLAIDERYPMYWSHLFRHAGIFLYLSVLIFGDIFGMQVLSAEADVIQRRIEHLGSTEAMHRQGECAFPLASMLARAV